MSIISPRIKTSVRITTQPNRIISNDVPITGWDSLVAVGRMILLIGKKDVGGYEIKQTTFTDSSGNYQFIVQSNANDEFWVVAIGRRTHEEFNRILGNIIAEVL